MITLYGRRNSSNVQRVIWLLTELGLDYETQRVGGSFGGTGGAYRELNPTGAVPALTDGELAIWESDAINRYLAARYGAGGPFWREDPAARTRADSWLLWLAIQMGPAMNAMFYSTVRKPRAEQDPSDIAAATVALIEKYRFLDAGLARAPYLSGQAFGLADIPAGIWAYRYHTIVADRPDLAHLADWYARIQSRPAFEPHIRLPMGTCLEEWTEIEARIA